MDVRLSTRTAGRGRPVLLLHGLGASSHYWDRVIATGSGSGFRFIAPDLAGFGRSPKPDDGRYDIPFHVAALDPLLEPGMLVAAHSAGTALAAALLVAGAVDGALLIAPPAFPDEATAREEVGRLGLLARSTVQGRPSARWICEVMCRVRPVATTFGPLLVKDLPRVVVADGFRHTWPSYSRTLEHLVVRHRLSEVLAEVTRPVQVLHGSEDEVAPLHHVRALPISQDQVTVVPGDHHVPVRRPQAVVSALLRLAEGT